MNKKLFFAAFALLFGASAMAQTIERQTISSVSMLTDGPDAVVSASVGETVWATSATGSFWVAQGFEQPSGDVSLSSEELGGQKISFRAFPNPATDLLSVEIDLMEPAKLGFAIFDATGRLAKTLERPSLWEAGTTSKTFSINGLDAGKYALAVTDAAGRQLWAISALKF